MNDEQLRRDITDELGFDPSINAEDIGVAVDDGIVSLTGHVRMYCEKITTINIVESVKGVRAILDEIEVKPTGARFVDDDEIARRIIHSLKWNTSVPEDRIQVVVKKGWVTLVGEVEWRHQSIAAEKAIQRLYGVTGISNRITVTPRVDASDVTERIRKALVRDAELDASRIRVEVQGGVVTLEGKVRHYTERECAERAAWAAPGVVQVVDHLKVS